MSWRYVGLQDDEGDGIRRARITEGGALVVSVAGGLGGGGGTPSIPGDGSVTISHITTTDKLNVSLAEVLTNDEIPVRIGSVTGNLSVEVINENPLPVEISNTGSLSVQVDTSTPLRVELPEGPLSVTAAGGNPLPVEIKSPSPIPVSLPSGPLPVTVTGSVTAPTGPNAPSGFGSGPGTVTAPAADTLITSHSPTTTGKLHLVEVTAWLSEGTPLAADNYNMAFKSGGATVGRIPVLAAVNMPVTSRFYCMSTDGASFGVHAAAAGSPGVKYNAFLTATRLV